MSKRTGIIVALVLALIFTMLIVLSANKKYTQIAKTVQVAQATHYIPAGSEITAQDVKSAEVVESAANGLATYEDVIGKTAKVSLLKDQFVYQEGLTSAMPLSQGFVGIYVPVELESSALALPGEKVNVHIVNKDTKQAPVVLRNITVLSCMDNQAREVEAGGTSLSDTASQKNIPAVVGLMVPEGAAEGIVYAANEKNIYLTKVAPIQE